MMMQQPAMMMQQPAMMMQQQQPAMMQQQQPAGQQQPAEAAFDSATMNQANGLKTLTSSDVVSEQASSGLAGIRDPQLAKLASKMGLKPPSANLSWLATLCSLLEQIPVAALVTDMRTPGLPITFANRASLELTGRAEDELVGKNCRVLQGQRTEGAAVRIITDSLRKAKPVILRITNYNKSNEPFKNVLCLQPVYDSAGDYRYSIGLQANEVTFERDPSMYEKLRKLLPTKFDVAAQPKRFDIKTLAVDEEAQNAQWQKSIAKFTRLVWSMDWEGTLERFLRSEMLFQPFFKWVSKKDANAAAQLELCYRMIEMQTMGLRADQMESRAVQLCTRYLGTDVASGGEALSLLQGHVANAASLLATEVLPKFVQTKACLPVVEEIVKGKGMRKSTELLWSQYEVPPDVAGWLHSFVPVAETYPACIVISDMLMPGNPMCFVNPEFCRVTGYAKDEVQGRNCRFLQGPRTEPQSVAVIQDTLRRGVDCHVRITNYRKSGDLFENLLTMRPVHDSNGVYRFCIGVQFEVVPGDTSLKQRLQRLTKLVQLLPKVIEVPTSEGLSVAHARDESSVERDTSVEDKLGNALQGGKQVYTSEAMLEDGAFYASHHADQLAYIAARQAAPAAPSGGSPMPRPKPAAFGGGLFGFGATPPKIAPASSPF